MKSVRIGIWGLLVLASVLFSAPAYALTVLREGEARSFLGDKKQMLVSGNYSYNILGRSHRDSMNGRFSDAVAFAPNQGKFIFPRRKDGDRIIIFSAPDGREEPPVTEDAWRQKIENTLSDDNRDPYVFLDDNKKVLGILFVGNYTHVTSKINDRGLLEVAVVVEGFGDNDRHHRRGVI